MARREEEHEPSAGAKTATDRDGAEQGRLSVLVTPTLKFTTYGPGQSSTPTTTSATKRNSTPRVTGSPERLRRNSSGLLIPILEEGGHMEFNQHARHLSDSIIIDAEEDDDEDMEEWLLEQELEKEGLHRGSFKRLLTMYTTVPTTTILSFGLLAALPLLAYPLDPNSPHSPYPYSPSMPYPFPELLTAAALWSMSLLFRGFISSLTSSLSTSLPDYAAVVLSMLATMLHTALTVALQTAAVVLLLITPSPGFELPTWRDHAFRRVWTVALGWAGAEAIVGIKQGYENIALYRDVLVNVKRICPEDHTPRRNLTDSSLFQHDLSPGLTRASTGQGSLDSLSDDGNFVSRTGTQQSLGERQPLLTPRTPQANGAYRFSKKDLEQEVQNDLDRLVALKSREELEEIYGIPLIHIPVFISCLHRFNALLNSLGTFLLLSAAYLRSPYAPPIPERMHNFFDSSPASSFISSALVTVTKLTESSRLLGVTVTAVLACQVTLALLHTAWILPRIGVPTYVYIGLLISLSLFFSGLALWGALV